LEFLYHFCPLRINFIQQERAIIVGWIALRFDRYKPSDGVSCRHA
jgi:hypothetical protein